MTDILQWNDLAERYDDTLLLGNGASIAVDSCFSYGSLLQEAEFRGHITSDLRIIFDYLDTKDFELVMSMVRTAYHVNKALGITDPKTEQAYQEVRTALVSTARDVHPSYESVAGSLSAMHRFMKRFDAETVSDLSNLGLSSAYHQLVGCSPGAEPDPTLLQQRKLAAGFHIDYCFVPDAWLGAGSRATVGGPEQWLADSDHMPLVLDLDLESRAAVAAAHTI
jgi:hypothetical protein